MPFRPLTPEEEKKHDPPVCHNPQHFPPTHMVIRETMVWVCPSYGKEQIVRPVKVMW